MRALPHWIARIRPSPHPMTDDGGPLMRLTCFALLAAALAAGCADPPPSQTLSGRVATDDFPARVLGVRAVEEGVVVAQGPVDANGRFSLNVPKGGHYRLEVVTRAGIHQFITPDHGSPRVMAFDACGDSYDFGDVGFWEEGDPLPDCNGGDDGSGGGDGTDPGQCTDPMDPDCNGGCDPSTGMDC